MFCCVHGLDEVINLCFPPRNEKNKAMTRLQKTCRRWLERHYMKKYGTIYGDYEHHGHGHVEAYGDEDASHPGMDKKVNFGNNDDGAEGVSGSEQD